MASIIYMKGHNENIYFSLFQQQQKSEADAQFQSQGQEKRRRNKKPPKIRTKPECFFTEFGVRLKHPRDYLIKHSLRGKPVFICNPKSKHEPKNDYVSFIERMPPAILMPPKKIDFIHDNAIEVIRRPARNPAPLLVDTVRGDKQMVLDRYVLKPDFGKVPEYVKIVKEIQHQVRKKMWSNSGVEKQEQRSGEDSYPRLRMLTDDERDKMLDGLKRNWAETYKEYLELPIMIDSVNKIRRKESMEKCLASLEKDIKMLEHYDTLYVLNLNIIMTELPKTKGIDHLFMTATTIKQTKLLCFSLRNKNV